MAKTKKGLSLVLAVVMLFSMLTVGSLAAEAQTADFAVAATVQDTTVNVTVSLTTNYFVGPLAVPVTYDAAAFDLVAGSLSVENIFGATTTDVVTSTQDGSVYVVISPKTNGAPTTEVANNKALFTFQLTAAADASGDYTVAITDDQKTTANPGGKWYCGAFDSADPKTAKLTTVGQTFTKTDATVTIGVAAKPELQLSARGEEIGAVISKNYGTADGYDGVVMGIDTLGLGVDGVTATLAESLTTPAGKIKINTDATGNIETTGALIELYDDSNKLVETYVFVYFGDVNSDGSVDTMDATSIEEYYGFVLDVPEEFGVMSMDANGDLSADTLDATLIEEYYGFISDLPTQASVAAAYAG